MGASRTGTEVTVRFTLPERTTDNLPIREGSVKASLCRGLEGAPCVTLAALQNVSLNLVTGESAEERSVTWTDALPSTLTAGEAKLLLYRVELSNLEGRTAGWSEPAYTVAGAPPAAVDGLRADETREGVLLRWQPGGNTGEVLLKRESLAAPSKSKKKDENEPVWLVSHAEANGPQADATLDSSAIEDVPYRYAALRRITLTLGGRKLELRSALSAPVEITWRNLFPPPTPTELSAAPFRENGGFAVDLVWEPVEEPGLKGYVVVRQQIDASGAAAGPVQRLTAQPVTLPAFHDATADSAARYRYSVSAVGHKGTESVPATVVVEPTGQ